MHSVHGPAGALRACGSMRRVSTRDRAGRPRCAKCPDEDCRDPVTVITAQVTMLGPGTDPEIIAAAVRQAAPRPSHQQRLAWAAEASPGLLTGAGHLAPVPTVLRLIDLLNDGGISAVIRPACPRCHRRVRIAKALDGQRVCRSCIARSRTEQCVRCGSRREPATRDGQGKPLCPNSLITHPANLETCLNCGRRCPVNTPTPAGPLCPTAAGSHLLNLRPERAMRDLPADRPAMVSHLPAAAGAPHQLQPARGDPFRHPGRASLRHLHQPGVPPRLPCMRGKPAPRPVPGLPGSAAGWPSC
ncbi:MAG TPA: hypothetical protein VG253_13960 [Streptosporangiaceae bacterium]|nr:hypothetical protein [Streptosporangiaceae bacterium]